MVRAATADDLPACHAVWLATEHPVPAGPRDTAAVLPLHEHELNTGRLVVATLGRQVVGFGATLTRSRVAYLADLFVRPEVQGRGIGRRLLHALLDDQDGPRFTMASTDPRAQRLYASFGMIPREDFYYLRADPATVDLSRLDSSELELVPAGIDDVIEYDRIVTCRDRRIDFEHARDHLGARLFLARRAGDVVGYASFVHPIWWNPWHRDAVRIGPIGLLDPGAAAAVLAATVRAAAVVDSSWLGPFVPESSPALRPLLAAGFRVEDTDVLMSSEPDLLDPARYHPAVDTA